MSQAPCEVPRAKVPRVPDYLGLQEAGRPRSVDAVVSVGWRGVTVCGEGPWEAEEDEASYSSFFNVYSTKYRNKFPIYKNRMRLVLPLPATIGVHVV